MLFFLVGLKVTTMTDAIQDLEAYQKFDEMMRVFRSAVQKAQTESRRLGVPNVYSFGGQIYYELPNGEYTRTPPPPVPDGDSNARRTDR